MKYDEFRVQILPGAAGRFRSRVDTSWGSHGEHEFELPKTLSPDQLSDRKEAGPHGQIGTDGKSDLGRSLFAAGLGDAGGRSFQRHRAAQAMQQADGEDVGTRVRLILGEGGDKGPNRGPLSCVTEVLPAAALPWEAMAEPDENCFFALSRFHSVVRTAGAAVNLRPARVKGPLRVLLVDAAPPELDAEEEIASIRTQMKDSLRQRYTVSIKVSPDGSWEATRAELEKAAYHILHFIGHGRFDPSSGVGSLIFRGSSGEDQPIDAHQLWRYLDDRKTLRLIFLNSCWSAAVPGQQGEDPMGSVALALSAIGVPAVLGMQIPIWDDSAVVFAREFYGRLRQRKPVEVAVAEGRRAIADNSPEWATPVLHLRGDSSELFQIAAGGLAKRDGERRLRLGIRTFVKSKKRPELEIWARKMSENTDSLLALEDLFEDRFIREPSAWRNEVLPRLNEFLRDATRQPLPLLFDFAAHATVAFAAGYFIHAKGGLSTAVIQRGFDSTETWVRDEGEAPPHVVWEPPKDEILDPAGRDLALAIEVSNPTQTKVRKYLETTSLPVQRLVTLSVAEGPGQDSVRSGAHAFALAQKVCNWLLDQPSEGPKRKVHLFWSAPNTFAFFLGRLAQGFGRVQLYEFDFEQQRHGTYEPSLELPAVPDHE